MLFIAAIGSNDDDDDDDDDCDDGDDDDNTAFIVFFFTKCCSARPYTTPGQTLDVTYTLIIRKLSTLKY